MAEPSWIGRTIGGRYQIERELGAGGMSTVYQATDQNLRRTVAVKMIHRHLSRDPQFVRRFEAEATVVARLKQPNIVQVYDFNSDGDTYYIVFEYVAGESLQDRLERLSTAGRVLLEKNVVAITGSIAGALNYAHAREVIHRDVKPANIMLDQNEQAILTDFGIAKIVGGTQHTASGVLLGTARYVSPEQVQGQPVTAQSDIYSLGATLFEMLAGRPPFEGDSVISTLMAHVTEPLPDLLQLRPNVSPALVNVVNTAMAKDPGARFRTAGDMAQALRAADQGPSAAGVAATGVAAAGVAVVAAGLSGAPAAGSAGPATGPGITGATVIDAPPPQAPGTGPAPAVAAPPPAGRSRRSWVLALVGGLAILLGLCAAVTIGYTLLSGDDETAGGGQGTESTIIADAGATAAVLMPTATRTATFAAGPSATPSPPPGVSPSETPAETPTQTPTDSPTATSTSTPTEAAPTEPPPTKPLPVVEDTLSAQIASITIQDGRYVVGYGTNGFTESLPGKHVHFFFDTVQPQNAGVPGSGPWILYGGPRPFSQYTTADRPAGATQMCVLVANADHSIQLGSGNCYPLPG